ncbi:hypothetical protein B0H14DRAFT_3148301 [Mycena olivaceomarginata]|nr:hypothetical protein B0H14DRAFT_3148301 [Mycena olivaceomarginata]
MPGADATTSLTHTTPTSSPRPAHREYAAAVLAFPRVPRPSRPPCLSLPLTAFLKARALLSRRPVSDARTDHREATMSFLGTGGDAIHPRRARNLRRAHFAMSPGLSSSPTDWDLERVLSAIRASVSEASANPGLVTRPPRNARQRARLGRGQGLHRRHSIHGG